MSEPRPLRVVLCWHMHQPEYRNMASGEFQLPWTYLHAIKDYADMVHHLEAAPRMRAVVNFTPVLLDQIAEYALEVNRFLDDGSAIRDPLLATLGMAVLPAAPEERIGLVRQCLRVNEERVINRYPAYRRLADMGKWILNDHASSAYLNNQFLIDLTTWYHLAWLGETVRRENLTVSDLVQKASGFSLHDRRALMAVIGELLESVIPRYKQLSDRGQIEISMSPHTHPILPLLFELSSAREALPDVRLPLLGKYPGGKRRAEWHMEQGRNCFARYFSAPPAGCWPSEGSVSDATIGILAKTGFKWTASGERVLANSLGKCRVNADPNRKTWLYRMYRDEKNGVALFFRDDRLSDLIGFTYAKWQAEDAANDFVRRLEEIAELTRNEPDAVVTIIVDGENAWEYYQENAYGFLSALYKRLSDHPRLVPTTFSEVASGSPKHGVLPGLVAGSWVYGNFSTWIGDEDKNRAWDILGEAKRAYDRAVTNSNFSDERLQRLARQLAICEGSDWFWWFGEYNPEETVREFERLFRKQIANLYQLMAVEPPQYLSQTFTHGKGTPALGGTIRPGADS